MRVEIEETNVSPSEVLPFSGFQDFTYFLVNGFEEGENLGKPLEKSIQARIRGALHAISSVMDEFHIEMPDVKIIMSDRRDGGVAGGEGGE